MFFDARPFVRAPRRFDTAKSNLGALVFQAIYQLSRCRRRKAFSAADSQQLEVEERSLLKLPPCLLAGVLSFADVCTLVAMNRANNRSMASVSSRVLAAFREQCPNAMIPMEHPALVRLMPLQIGRGIVQGIGTNADGIDAVLRLMCERGDANSVLLLVHGVTRDRNIAIVAALLSVLRTYDSRETLQQHACRALCILLQSEDQYKTIICDLQGVPLLTSMIRKSADVRMAALQVLDELSTRSEDASELFLCLPGAKEMRNAMRLHVLQELRSAELAPALGALFPELDEEERLIAVRIVHRVLTALPTLPATTWFALQLFEAGALRALLAEFQRSFSQANGEMHRNVRFILCFLVLSLTERRSDMQLPSCVHVGCRVLVKDSEKQPWRSGTVIAKQQDHWVVSRDIGEARTWNFVEAVVASASLIEVLEQLFRAGFIQSLLQGISVEEAPPTSQLLVLPERVVLLQTLSAFTQPIGSPAMREAVIAAGGVATLAGFLGLGGHIALEALYHLCYNSTAACHAMYDLDGVRLCVDRISQAHVSIEQLRGIAENNPDPDNIKAEALVNIIQIHMDTIDRILYLLCILFEADNRMRRAAIQMGVAEHLVPFLTRYQQSEEQRGLAECTGWTLMTLAFDHGPGPVPTEVTEDALKSMNSYDALAYLEKMVNSGNADPSFAEEASEYLKACRQGLRNGVSE